MREPRLEITIRRSPHNLLDEIYIYRRHEKAIENYTFRKNGSVVVENLDLHGGTSPNIPPALILDMRETEELIRAFVAIAHSKDIKTKSEDVMSGQLESTKYHLEDMRKLLKLDKK